MMLFKTGSVLRKMYLLICKRNSSALYISGEKAVATCPTVMPHVDLQECLNSFDGLENNINKRKCNVKIDRLREMLRFFLTINDAKINLEKRKSILSATMKELYEANNIEELEKLKIHNKLVREDLKNLKTALWPIEEQIVLEVLNLPNELHQKTPKNDKLEIAKFGEIEKEECSESHINIGHKNGLIIFSNPYNYYFKNEAAIFELEAKYFFSETLRDSGYLQFSNPDFIKSAIVEGCGLDHKSSRDVFILHHNEDTPVNENCRLHLAGGGSLLAFAGYHARNLLNPSSLPLRYYTLGRQYKPVSESSSLGLFEVSQSSVVEIFIATKDCQETVNDEIDKAIADITEIYKKIDYPFRICYTPAEKLSLWESMKISFEMYSPFYKQYIEVGFISVSGNFISKRLQFEYSEQKQKYFPRIISGTVLSVPRLLGCVLELDSSAPFKRPVAFENVSFLK